MDTLFALLIGLLFAAAIYMMLRRSIVKLVIGLVLLGHAINLLIFVVGRTTRGAPPLIGADETQLTGLFADPVPQALILTAIVIGFGVQAFALVLVKRVFQTRSTGDLNAMRNTEQLDAPTPI
ncbi:MAG: Na+/H+ antiporter subunit C [Caldilinea sp. CFX5]|nr:Na+/H+ antiporter subunit C [Caldilinea sp. CFX5]